MPNSGKTLIIGASGFVGQRLFDLLGSEACAGTYNHVPLTHGHKFDSVSMRISDLALNFSEFSQAVILCGDVDPDRCAKDIPRSYEINVASIIRMIDDLFSLGIKPFFVSTEAVFDGEKGDYCEDDATNAILAYGKQKVEVERYLMEKNPPSVILRLSKVYDSSLAQGSFLGNWYQQIIQGGKQISCADDFITCAVHLEDVVKITSQLLCGDVTGIFHIGGPDALSRYDICRILADEIRRVRTVDVTISPCSIHDFPTVEPRPLNVSLNTKKIRLETGHVFRNMQSVCREAIQNSFTPIE